MTCLQINTKYLSPLFLAYDDRLEEREKIIKRYQASFYDNVIYSIPYQTIRHVDVPIVINVKTCIFFRWKLTNLSFKLRTLWQKINSFKKSLKEFKQKTLWIWMTGNLQSLIDIIVISLNFFKVVSSNALQIQNFFCFTELYMLILYIGRTWKKMPDWFLKRTRICWSRLK